MSDDIFNKLNDKQKKVVESKLGSSLVVAGAGSGKTAVLTCRIAYLISVLGINPKKILAFTFTNKASNEMKERVYQILKQNSPNWITTFHGFCLRVLREDIDKIGLKNDFSVIDEEDQIFVIKEIYTKLIIDKTLLSYKICLQYINSIKLNNEEEEIFDFLNNSFDYDNSEKKKDIILKVFPKYQEYLILNNMLDFNDLIKYVKKLFIDNENVLKKWQNRFDYILIDEFQDTNYDQFLIIKKIAKDRTNIFVVGDPDQMIYSWRGAYKEIFDEFIKYFLNVEIYVLDKNYRSTKKILDVSNDLIKRNQKRIEKQLHTDNPDGNKVICFNAINQDQESRWIIDKINLLIHGKKYNFSDIAILYRNNFISRNIEQELVRNNIPYFIYGGFKFYQRKEVKDVIAYLKLICNNDDLSFSRICNIPKRKISENVITKLRFYSYEHSVSLFDSLINIDEIDLNSSAKNACIEFRELIISFKNKKYQSLVNLFEDLIDRTGYLKMLEEDQEINRIENINELKNAISQFEVKNPNAKLFEYLQEISLYTSLDEDNKKDKNFISLMTVHLAKGLEFKNVFLIEFNEGIFPSSRSIENNEIDEERRLAYVAMTRAKDNLFITSAEGIFFQSDATIKKEPSRFLNDISSNNNVEIISNIFRTKKGDDEHFNNFIKSDDEIKQMFYNENQDFQIGEIIVHSIFGEGVVIGTSGEVIEVSFQNGYGTKSLMKNHKSIKRKVS